MIVFFFISGKDWVICSSLLVTKKTVVKAVERTLADLLRVEYEGVYSKKTAMKMKLLK